MSTKRKLAIGIVIIATALFILIGIKESGVLQRTKKVDAAAVTAGQSTVSSGAVSESERVIIKNPAAAEMTEEEATEQNLKTVGMDDGDVQAVMNSLDELKAYYLSELSSLKDQCIAEYREKKENDPNINKDTVLNAYMPMITNLESECDSRVSDILSDLKTKLTAKNISAQNIADIIRQIENGYYDYKTETLNQYKAEINEAD